jgi:hypothetical protein
VHLSICLDYSINISVWTEGQNPKVGVPLQGRECCKAELVFDCGRLSSSRLSPDICLSVCLFFPTPFP